MRMLSESGSLRFFNNMMMVWIYVGVNIIGVSMKK